MKILSALALSPFLTAASGPAEVKMAANTLAFSCRCRTCSVWRGISSDTETHGGHEETQEEEGRTLQPLCRVDKSRRLN